MDPCSKTKFVRKRNSRLLDPRKSKNDQEEVCKINQQIFEELEAISKVEENSDLSEDLSFFREIVKDRA